MFHKGMDGARINTAYGTLEEYSRIVENIRKTAEIPIIADVKGPEIRLLASRRRAVKKGETLEAGFGNEEIRFNHDFYDKMALGDKVFIDNGKIEARVVGKSNNLLRLSLMSDGEIDDGKGVNVPNKRLETPTLSNWDLEVVKLARRHDLEYLALSFTRNAHDIERLKSQAGAAAVIAKIENSEGLENFEEILEAAHCIMVARGDLGVEIEPERVPLVQKSIVARCNQEGKPVIIATEMLESMIQTPRPTRAEVNDVANAILDGTDAMMLSGETSIGKYPAESVSMMTRIAAKTEASVKNHIENGKFVNISDTISKSIQRICSDMPIGRVVTLTRSGYTARMIARFKVRPHIIAVTPEKRIKKQLELVFGVHPVQLDFRRERDRILFVAQRLFDMNLIEPKDTVLFTAAVRTSKEHASNLIEIHSLEELLDVSEAHRPSRDAPLPVSS
jgi:pyruvate kinase